MFRSLWRCFVGWFFVLTAILQVVADAFYHARKCLLDCIAFLSLRCYGIEDRSFDEVREQTSNKVEYKAIVFADNANAESLLELAKDSYRAAKDRRNAVTDKFKILQTLSAFLLTMAGVFLPRAFVFEAAWMRWAFYLAVLFLLNTVTLLLVYLAVGAEAVVGLDQQKADMDEHTLKQRLINDYGRCTVAINNRTDYLVDIYRAARFFFLFAFTIIVVLLSVSYLWGLG
jgi:hypothetical protein